MKYYDITQINEKGMAKYPTAADFKLTFDRDYDLGFDLSLSHFEMSSHLGTHLDSPYHMIKGGKRIEDLPLERFIGRCQVITIKNRDFICEDDLKKIDIQAERLIFKTDNYERIRQGSVENVYIKADAGEYLASLGVGLIGIDYFSVDKNGDKTRQAHKSTLGNDMAILEGIFPQDVPDGIYFLMCLPLRNANAEGCPCRALLFEYEDIEGYISNRE